RFVEQKHFIENASHELQTPLAISINKLELFIENNTLDETQLAAIASVLDNLGQLTRLNKSLSLLSKIENQQFSNDEAVDFNQLSTDIVADFEDFSLHKNVDVKIGSGSKLVFRMNKDLAVILLTNLIKNAVVHGNPNETIRIDIEPTMFTIRNSGKPKALKPKIFSRFKKMSPDKKSTGLGLAIAKAIANKYNIRIDYEFDGTHNFKMVFPKKS
ncbi:MAG TPA: HAMP domain-containing sensor histidine kinase, partial [Aquaticitalea sp.]|nr:HAMP domain-containing sensor histidine kinase [Aquaticitalea sp.]